MVGTIIDLSDSVLATVQAREGKIRGACLEISHLVNDWRAQAGSGRNGDCPVAVGGVLCPLPPTRGADHASHREEVECSAAVVHPTGSEGGSRGAIGIPWVGDWSDGHEASCVEGEDTDGAPHPQPGGGDPGQQDIQGAVGHAVARPGE